MRTDVNNIRVLAGEWDKPGCEFEIVDIPVYEVDPVTRKARNSLQRFRLTAITPEGERKMEPIHADA